MSIEKEIAEWDGKSVDAIRAILESHRDDPGFADTIIALSGVDRCQRGSTWLLKTWLDEGNSLKAYQITAIYDLLGVLGHWEARLHVLQSIPSMDIHRDNAAKVWHFIQHNLGSRSNIVRAWSYNALCVLAKQHEAYRDDAVRLLGIAAQDEAASVRARVRNMKQEGCWDSP